MTAPQKFRRNNMYEWEDEEKQRLNEFFKSLSEQDEESRAWKVYNDHVVLFLIDQFTKCLKDRCKCPFVLQPCGSSIEDFRCYFKDDVGDVDVVICPGLEDLEVQMEEMIEYLPDSPLHVRINGAGHPLLQSCLVENTKYVATSVLKKFHPTIYGGSSYFLNLVPQVVEVMSRREAQAKLDEQFFVRMKQRSPGSALSLEFAQSFAPMHEQLKDLSGSASFNASDWEWLCYFLYQMNGTDYNRQHAELLDEYMRHCEESFRFLGNNPSGVLQGFPSFVQEICCGGKVQQLKARFEDIEKESGSRSRTDAWPDGASGRGDPCVTPGKQQHPDQEKDVQPMQSPVNDALEALSSLRLTENVEFKAVIPNKGGMNRDEKAYSGEARLQNQMPLSTEAAPFEDPQSSRRVFARQFSGEGGLKSPVVDKERDAGKYFSVEGKSLVEFQRGQNIPFCDEDEKRQRNARIFNHICSHAAGFENAESAEESDNHQPEESKSHFRRVGGADFVPAFKARGWPKVAQEWIQRKRTWPSPETVEAIVCVGFHIAAKAPKVGGNPDRDFKLSFSNAEYILSRELNNIQRDCYRCLKKYYHTYLRTEPKSLVTYHLKHILFHVCEETDVAIWTDDNRAHCTMLLFRKLHDALTTKYLSHYFVAASNMFDENSMENCDILTSLAVIVGEIMQNPTKFPITNGARQKEAERIERGESAINIDSRPGWDNGTNSPVEGTCGRSDLTICQNDHGTDLEVKGASTENGVSKLDAPGTSRRTAAKTKRSESNRYHDLKDSFIEICHEVVSMAMDGSEVVKSPDPVERSVVADIKDLATEYGIGVDGFLTILSCGWDAVSFKVLLNAEPDVRRRMLEAIQGLLELYKSVLRQPDFGAGNEEAIAERLLDPASAETFDLSHVLPSGCVNDLIALVLNGMKPPSTHVQAVSKDDIPLD